MTQQLAINPDYFNSTENPEPRLKKISEAGFTHMHWCHHWNTDYIYSDSEIDQIITWLKKYNLKMLNIHASEGKENNWVSQIEDRRKKGVELVKNRIYMANRLSCDVIVLHFNREPEKISKKEKYWQILHKSLDEIQPYAKEYNVKIALENFDNEDSKEIKKLFSEYGPDFLGLCYDNGHGNIGNGLKTLEELKDRLIALHIHDNDGKSDQHKIPFSGTEDWAKLAKIIAESSYKSCISLEVMTSNISNESQFLSEAYEAGLKFRKMVENYSD